MQCRQEMNKLLYIELNMSKLVYMKFNVNNEMDKVFLYSIH